MTLAQWAESWPYRVKRFRPTDANTGQFSGPETDTYVTPDAVHHTRVSAFSLGDYRVSSVSGGSLWFVKRGQS